MKNLVDVIIFITLFVCVLGSCGQVSSSNTTSLSASNLSMYNLSINGTLFEDKNKNAIFDPDERGLVGWVIRLKLEGKEIANTTTNNSGQYKFNNLEPGVYTILQDQKSGWIQSFPGSGSYNVSLIDKDAYRLDFGNFMLVRTAFGEGANVSSIQYQQTISYFTPAMRENLEKSQSNMTKAYLSPEITTKLAMAPAGQHYDLLAYFPYIASDRYQGYCGNCWVWGSTGCVEIDRAVRIGIKERLSTQYLNSNFHGGKGCAWACCGGLPSNFAEFYSTAGIFVPWNNSNAQFNDAGQGCNNNCNSGSKIPANSISTLPNYKISAITENPVPTWGVGKSQAIANIKNVLNQNKAIAFCYWLPDTLWDPANPNSFRSFWSSKPVTAVWKDFPSGMKDGGGHCVLCVGYDDTDPNNSYWIMVNSWGSPSNRQDGTFRVSMNIDYDSIDNQHYHNLYWTTFNVTSPTPNPIQHPPNIPIIPLGPGSGVIGGIYSYETSAIDPDGDMVRYTFDWGDGNTSTTDLVNSGTNASASYVWSKAGIYQVKVFATDSKGATSELSDPLNVTINENLNIYNLSISGTKFEDKNSNGLHEVNESGISNWIIKLKQNNIEIANVTTNESGMYEFENLESGRYVVEEEKVEGWNTTMPGSGFYNITLLDKKATNYDFGNTKGIKTSTHTIMQITPLQAKAWQEASEKLPETYINPEVKAKLEKNVEANPASYSLLNHLNYNTEERDQHNCENCWVWGSTAVAEIDNDVQNSIFDRLSIQYFNSNFNGGSGSCCPNLPDTFVSEYNNNLHQFVPWSNSNAEWHDGGVSCCAAQCPPPNQNTCCTPGLTTRPASSILTTPNYPITSITISKVPTHNQKTREDAINNIKAVLLQNKAVIFGFSQSDGFSSCFNYWDNQFENDVWPPEQSQNGQTVSGLAGHIVTLVGYDDTNPSNRYWIMVNSWGEATDINGIMHRPNGIMLVSQDNMDYDCVFNVADSNGNLIPYGAFWFYSLDINWNSANIAPNTPSTPTGPVLALTGSPNNYCTSTVDPNGNKVKYTFDWGDGTSVTGFVNSGDTICIDHKWNVAGSYQVKAKATDIRGADSGWSNDLTVLVDTPPNAPIEPSGDSLVLKGTKHTYCTSGTDPDDDQVKYTFDWGDGSGTGDTVYVNSGDTACRDQPWNTAGVFQVRAKATDIHGIESGWSSAHTVIVNTPPNAPAIPSGPTLGLPGTIYNYCTSANDMDGNLVKYTFDWGDGKSDTTYFVNSGATACASHNWSKAGIYQIKAYATDIYGAQSDWSNSLSILIDTPPNTPTTPVGPNLGKPGRTYSYSTSATDPDGDLVKYTFDWGDGKNNTTYFVNSGTILSVSHKWTNAGTYQVKALATDNRTISSGWSSPLIISIKNDSIGVYRSYNHWFYLDTNNNRSLDPSDINVSYGKGGDLAVVGDWNGDSIDELGVFRPSTATFYLDTNGDKSVTLGDKVATLNLNTSANKSLDIGIEMAASSLEGNASTSLDSTNVTTAAWQMGDLPVAGDWNSDGKDEIGIFRRGFFYLDSNGNGTLDPGDVHAFNFGRSGDLPVAGDWNGDGKDKIAVFRPNTGMFYLDYNANRALDSGDISANFGMKGDTPVVGDWNGDGKDEIGVFRAGKFYLDYNGNGISDSGDVIANFGFKGDLPVAGVWG